MRTVIYSLLFVSLKMAKLFVPLYLLGLLLECYLLHILELSWNGRMSTKMNVGSKCRCINSPNLLRILEDGDECLYFCYSEGED
jgi:hypothetical protein